MNRLASTLPEYPVVMSIEGVGPTFNPQLIVEIGGVSHFTRRDALGVDPGKKRIQRLQAEKFVYPSKKGSPHLRKTLFQKFLRTHYGRVNEYLSQLEETEGS